MVGFAKSSMIGGDIEDVWRHVTTQAGINEELAPVLRMTMPAAFRGRSVGDVVPGTRVGRSRLLLLGIVPIGHDDITVARIEPGHMFREESRMSGMRRWVHQRTLALTDGGIVVTDEVEFEPAFPMSIVPGAGMAMRAALLRLFDHRHERLLRRFGSLAGK